MRIRWRMIEEGIQIFFNQEQRGIGLIVLNEMWFNEYESDNVIDSIEDAMFNVSQQTTRDDATNIAVRIEQELIVAREGEFNLDDERPVPPVTEEERRRMDDLLDELVRPTPVHPLEEDVEEDMEEDMEEDVEEVGETVRRAPRPTNGMPGHMWRANQEPLPVEMVLIKSVMTLLYKRLLITGVQYEAMMNTLKPGNSVEELVYVIDAINKGEL